jgi:hypothetical protein
MPLLVLRDDRSACLVSLQRFRGKLRGRAGTFVLQGTEIIENGTIKATWFVVPGSGTGDLSGLHGEGGFEGQFGKGSVGTLEYWFEGRHHDGWSFGHAAHLPEDAASKRNPPAHHAKDSIA